MEGPISCPPFFVSHDVRLPGLMLLLLLYPLPTGNSKKTWRKWKSPSVRLKLVTSIISVQIMVHRSKFISMLMSRSITAQPGIAGDDDALNISFN